MLARPNRRREIPAIEVYVPGKNRAGVARIHSISANEAPLGVSPRAIKAFRASAVLVLHPDGSAPALREAIGKRYGLDSTDSISASGIEVTPSVGNFLLLVFHTTVNADTYLSQRGFVLRSLWEYGLPEHLQAGRS